MQPASDQVLPMWVVYDHPLDFPNSFVARLWTNDPDTHAYRPTGEIIISPPWLREQFREQGLVPIARDVVDDPKIVETWL